MKLKERNPKWINDDYVKFIRYGQHFIEEKNGSGILAFINPHGYLDNPTFRGMRWNLLKTYDKIYTIDLHGNTKKKEVSLDGSPDINVFDIEQGVSINLFIKSGFKEKSELGTVYHYDLYGKRDSKYDFLIKNSRNSIAYNKLENIAPNYYFVNKNFKDHNIYEEGFKISQLFNLNNAGIVTANDSILIDENRNMLINKVGDYYKISTELKYVNIISYRPFDNRYIYYDSKLIERSRGNLMKHFINTNNIGLASIRINKERILVEYLFPNFLGMHVLRIDF